MKVLLLGATGAEPSFAAWQAALVREGVPFETVALRDAHDPIAFFDRAGDGRYQAVIFATGGMIDEALSDAELDALQRLQLRCGVRRLIAYTCPGPIFGLHGPAWGGPVAAMLGTLTAAGQAVFPYLRGTVPIEDGSWAYLAVPLGDAQFETLLAGPGGSALVGIHTFPDGREELVQTIDSNPGQVQSQLLRHGELAWVTRGCYLGYERNYLPLQVDDVLLPNRSWNVTRHEDDDDPAALIRMTAEDAVRAARWSRAHGLRIDLGANGSGSDRYTRENGLDSDPLLTALTSQREVFGWINHTYSHLDLDAAPQEQIEAEIERNLAWARRLGIRMQPDALVTGEHTGLANLIANPPSGENPAFGRALAARRIRYVGCDASRPYPVDSKDPRGPRWAPGSMFAVGPAVAVPRHPTVLPYDAARAVQALDRRRAFDPRGVPLSWNELVSAEAKRILAVVMANDPCPHFFHQANLTDGDEREPVASAGGPVFYALLNLVLERYREWFAPSATLEQPTLGEAAELLLRWSAWRNALKTGLVRGYVSPTSVTIVNDGSAALHVPVLGTELGSEYAGMRSGWVLVERGERALVRTGSG
jgi:peptidoglycan/xylan/chitin deacetylase (PgdA/CDA1 family)